MSSRFIERVFLGTGEGCPDKKTLETIEAYFQELIVWNKKTDLTGLRDLEAMAIKHLGDTLTLLPYIEDQELKILDIGTGAGIPGILLKILRPKTCVVLVDSRRKRISFLRYCIARLGLKDIEAINMRLTPESASTLTKMANSCKNAPSNDKSSPYFDVALSRATLDLSTMAKLARPLLKKRGHFILMKGPKGLQEIESARPLLVQDGWKIWYRETNLPIIGDRRVLVFGMVAFD